MGTPPRALAEQFHQAPWPVDNGGFAVCRLHWSSGCFVIVRVHSDQLGNDCNLDGHFYFYSGHEEPGSKVSSRVPPEVTSPWCLAGGGAGVLLSLVVFLETRVGNGGAAGQACEDVGQPGACQRISRMLEGVRVLFALGDCSCPDVVVLAPYCHGNPWAPPSQHC